MYNRNYKDSVFVDLFAHDIKAKENFISLYNALHNTHLDTTTEVKPVMLEKVLYMKYYNDIAMLIDGKIVVMIEHQSTVNENMPFRFLEYIARIYEKITSPEEKFGRKLVKLPIPEFYVFYNGKEDYPVESEMKLSNAFFKEKEVETFPLEISVKVININVDKDNPILKRCQSLRQYSAFIEKVREMVEAKRKDPLSDAIREAIGEGILEEYLERKSVEVRNMLLMEYDYDTDIKVQRKEAYNDGLEQGVKQGIEQGVKQKSLETARNMIKNKIPLEVICDCTSLDSKTIQKIIDEKI